MWISALRLRTLPLALSSIIVGAGLAAVDGYFTWPIFILALFTALFLQILSNLANDLGDSEHGADNAQRQGPVRGVQSGLISKNAMFRAIIITACLAVCSGLGLIGLAFHDDLYSLLSFLFIGLCSIVAAITYTMGDKPYGYRGLGDVSVFVFFGLVGVYGCYYLFHHHFEPRLLLPAITSGLLATAVLNINNIRDERSDALAGKRTLVVKLGAHYARLYHIALIALALITCVSYLLIAQKSAYGWLALLFAPWLLAISFKVYHSEEHWVLNKLLKHTAMASLCFNSAFALGIQY